MLSAEHGRVGVSEQTLVLLQTGTNSDTRAHFTNAFIQRMTDERPTSTQPCRLSMRAAPMHMRFVKKRGMKYGSVSAGTPLFWFYFTVRVIVVSTDERPSPCGAFQTMLLRFVTYLPSSLSGRQECQIDDCWKAQ